MQGPPLLGLAMALGGPTGDLRDCDLRTWVLAPDMLFVVAAAATVANTLLGMTDRATALSLGLQPSPAEQGAWELAL